METMADFIFLGSKITAGGDCSHEIKTLAPWKKSDDKLDIVLKSKHIPLPTKVRIVKAMVFPVVIFRYDSWTLKKAEHQRIDAFELVLEKTLENPLDCKIKPVNPKGNQP